MASCGFSHGGDCLWSAATSEKGEEVFVQRLNAGGGSPARDHGVEIMVARYTLLTLQKDKLPSVVFQLVQTIS